MIPIFRQKDRAKLFSRVDKRKTLISGRVLEQARDILSQVRTQGDAALLKLTRELDGVELHPARDAGRPAGSAEPRLGC